MPSGMKARQKDCDMAWTQRTELLVGKDGLEKLKAAHVVIVGCGGVGAYAAEMLARSGVGTLTIIDSDEVSDTNRNRQLLALTSTVGASKCDVLSTRLKDINPEMNVISIKEYLNESNVASLIGLSATFVIDAIDTLSPKIALIQHCVEHKLPLVSSMGSGAKFDATKVRIADISETYQCPLAHMLRKRLHKFGIRSGFLAVFSEELPHRESMVIEESANKKSQVGTVSYLPAVFGCVCAQAVITRIVGVERFF